MKTGRRLPWCWKVVLPQEEKDFDGCFLEGKQIKPKGLADDSEAGGKARIRWSVKDSDDFDFKEFRAS